MNQNKPNWKKLLEFYYSDTNLEDLEPLIVGHSIVAIETYHRAYECYIWFDNGIVLEFLGTEGYSSGNNWEVDEYYKGQLPSLPVEDVKNVDHVYNVTRGLMAGPCFFNVTLGGAETTLVSFMGAGDGEWGTGYACRVYKQATTPETY